MSRKLVFVLCLFVLLSPLLHLRLNSVAVKAPNGYPVHNITTRQNFTTIQEAINNAGHGDTIVVEAGIYNEDVVVNQTVSLIGEDRHNTIVNGSGNAPVFYIQRSDVKITNFTMQNNNLGGWAGVYVSRYDSGGNVSHNIIRNCSIGVRLWDYTVNNYVVDNEILNCKIGVEDWYTSGNFIIRNNISLCSEYGVSVEGSEDSIVQGNTISDCWGGIYLSFGSSQIVISDNDISNCDGGIGLDSSSSNTVTNNRVEHCEVSGIYLGEALYVGSDNNVVTNNTISFSTQGEGLFIYGSTGNNLSGNIMLNNLYNFGVEGEELSDFINFIDTSNTVDGKPIYYWINELDVDVPLDAGYVGLVNCTRVTVQNLNLTNNWQGVLLAFTANCTITGNNVKHNYYGIELYGSSSNCNVIYENDIVENEYGAWLVDSSNNTFYHNNFIGNTNQVGVETWDVNTWDDGYPSGGNYWSDFEERYPDVEDIYSGPYQNETGGDGFWDEPYTINAGNIDHYPIVPEFPTWTSVLLLLIVLTVAIAIYKRKLIKAP